MMPATPPIPSRRISGAVSPVNGKGSPSASASGVTTARPIHRLPRGEEQVREGDREEGLEVREEGGLRGGREGHAGEPQERGDGGAGQPPEEEERRGRAPRPRPAARSPPPAGAPGGEGGGPAPRPPGGGGGGAPPGALSGGGRGDPPPSRSS